MFHLKRKKIPVQFSVPVKLRARLLLGKMDSNHFAGDFSQPGSVLHVSEGLRQGIVASYLFVELGKTSKHRY